MGSDTEAEAAERAARERTVTLFKAIVVKCVPAARNGTDQQRALVEDAATQLYFASGAFRAQEGLPPLSEETVVQFYNDLRDSMSLLGTAGVTQASTQILDTLDHLHSIADATHLPSDDLVERFITVADDVLADQSAPAYWAVEAIDRFVRRCVAARDSTLSREDAMIRWSQIMDRVVAFGVRDTFLLARDFDLSL
jgi:hypothetical protein